MKKPFFTAEDFGYVDGNRDHDVISCIEAMELANAKLEREGFVVGKYRFTQPEDGMVWISKDGGEGMGVSEVSMDKIWKEIF